MKKLLPIFLILIVCNISFSQEKKPELPIESVGIENLEEPVFKFYPNPVDDELFVIGTYKIKSIEIVDVLGKVVAIYQFDKSIIRMNVSELKPGMYLLKVIDINDRLDIKKLVVK
jgi:hypothetical protein